MLDPITLLATLVIVSTLGACGIPFAGFAHTLPPGVSLAFTPAVLLPPPATLANQKHPTTPQTQYFQPIDQSVPLLSNGLD